MNLGKIKTGVPTIKGSVALPSNEKGQTGQNAGLSRLVAPTGQLSNPSIADAKHIHTLGKAIVV